MASLELDLDEKIFDEKSERQKLQEQMAQLSPRREATVDKSQVMTLPFYEDISPSVALKKLFNWFHSSTPVSTDADTSAEETGEQKQDEDSEQPAAVANKETAQAISMDEFNCLLRCLGKSEIEDREWRRALEELGMAPDKKVVRETDFKALFGPPPFFGSEDVQGIVSFVMHAEERIHFAQILVDQFGIVKPGSAASVASKVIGLKEIQTIQEACYMDPVFSEPEWSELKQKLSVPYSQSHLDWKKFTEAFAVSIKGRKMFGSFSDPASVVFAVLANDKVKRTLQESNDGMVSRTTITNLLKLKQSHVSDEKWMQLLEGMQTSYRYQKNEDPNENVEPVHANGTESTNVPLVVVRNTRNQVLSYEITFDDSEEVGLELQSDFYGHCLTVKSISGQAAKHPIIKELDIVAMVNKKSLTYKDAAVNEAEEKKRVYDGMEQLEGKKSRKITFQRQESYFQYDHEQKILRLSVKLVEDISGGGKIQIRLPVEASLSPTAYDSTNADACLLVLFNDSEEEHASVLWIPDTKTIEITLDNNFPLAASTSVVMEISDIGGVDARMVGPCEFDDNSTIPCLKLFRGWKSREIAFHTNPVRERVRRLGDFYDRSLEPIEKNFAPGESGIELVSDFFGQCAVVKAVKEHSQAAARDIHQFDILTSISYVGEKNSLERVHCIKSLASDKENTSTLVKDISKILSQRYKSGGMYRLQFLRLNSHFYHDNGRTIITLHPLTNLTDGSALVLRMPNTKWHVSGPLTASVFDPAHLKVKEVFWDSQQQTLHTRLGLTDSSIDEPLPIVIEIQGISSGDETKKRCAGLGELIGVHAGDEVSKPEMEVQFYDRWDVVAQETYDTKKVVDTLKQFETSPAKLWDVLEYTTQLFEMFKPSATPDHISLSDLNRLISIVCGDKEKMKEPKWRTLCASLGADPYAGLTRHQFACCWYDVVGLSSHTAKDTYVRLHSAQRLFEKLIKIYQDEDGEKDVMSKETITRLMKFFKISTQMKNKAIEDLKKKGLNGWNCDVFSQIVCGMHPIIKFEEKDATAVWTKLYYAEKLFDAYSTKKRMRKMNMGDLLTAAKIKTPKFTSDLWSIICDSVGVDDAGGLALGDFLDVYAGDLLGSRHAVADWYRIETFKMLPERRAKEDTSKEAVMSVAPEKINVNDIAAKVLEQTASTEEIFQDLVEKGLEFSKLAKIKDREDKTFAFDTSLHAKKKSRATGFLSIGLKSITELADHIIQRDPSFDAEGVAEELYVMFQITDAQGLKPRLPERNPRNFFRSVRNALFGQRNFSNDYVVKEDEMWDQGRTQGLMRDMKKAKAVLKGCKPRSKEYTEALEKLQDLERQLMPLPPLMTKVPDWRVFSSLILRNPSPDAIIRFPGDKFRLFVPPHESTDQLYIVCKLFKRIGSAASRLTLELEEAQAALKKANDAHEILVDLVRQQQNHLRFDIADRHMRNEDDPKTVVGSAVWTSVAKLKQLRHDLADFERVVTERKAEVERLTQELKVAVEAAEKNRVARDDGNEPSPQDLSDPETTIPGNESSKTRRRSLKPNEENKARRPSVKNILTGDDGNPERRLSLKNMLAGTETVSGDKPDDSKTRLEAEKVKFIGQAFFDLGELLNVLHADKERTEDLAVFRTETHNDVGVVLLSFKYKCSSLQEQSFAADLPSLPIKMAADDVSEQEIDEIAFEYPSSSHLEIEWKSDALKRGDRICLIREGTKYKVSMPFFFLLWNAFNEEGKPISFDVKDNEIEKIGTPITYDWWVPDVLASVYTASQDSITKTDPTRRSGNLHFPSSIDLSLPPGIYKLYLIRNEKDEDYGLNFRTVLGKSASLAVLPGINGVHTSFGTTPLVDVKAMSASLQVFMESNRDAVAASLTNSDGFRDEDYLARIARDQELAVARNDLQARKNELLSETLKKKERTLIEEKIPDLESVIGTLEKEKRESVGASVLSADVVVTKQPEGGDASSSAITSSGRVAFVYTFYGDAPTPRDKIVVLPADVVRVSDLLRATILGKLQANDQRQVEKARAAMEQELLEVEEIFNVRISLKTFKKVVWRFFKPIWKKLVDNVGSAAQSDAYNAATGAADDTFVWEEVMAQYNSCSSATKKSFPYIINDLLDEIGARKNLLGLTAASAGGKKNRLGKATSLLKCGTEISIPPLATTFKEDNSGNRIAVGEVSMVLGSRFRQGGFYVAKYVRRGAIVTETSSENTTLNESAGELCRYGPFYVEKAIFSWSFVQVALVLGKWIYKVLSSDEGKLLLKSIGQAYLSLVKYFLAVVSLSFNINVLAGNFKVDVKHLKELMNAFKARLLRFYGPLETVLMTIYTFFSGYIHELVEKMKVYYIAGDCFSGFFLFAVLGMLFAAAFIVYVVVQEDLLRKVQKLHTYLPINPGKSVLGILEQIGALLVIPLYLSIKSCVLFISSNWSDFYHLVHDDPSQTHDNLKLYTTPTRTCPNVSLAKVNHGFGIAALVLIIFFLCVCLPLLLLDLFSWVPISELEAPEKLHKLAHSHNRMDIKAAVHSNASLVSFHPIRALQEATADCFAKVATSCKCRGENDSSICSTKCGCITRAHERRQSNPLFFSRFARHYDDYVNMPFRDLVRKYGLIGLFAMFVHVYAHLMLQSIGRALGIFLAWRWRADHMYPKTVMKSKSRWKVFDVFCLRFNLAWKIQYIKDKMVMPFVNICLVTLGLWGESQSKEFNVEERANDCYRMEPSGEIKQLQMMALHGKIVSLFWLCIPKTMVLAYLAEVLNRGPVFSYFLNNQFLQADIPESEREKDPVWRFHWLLAFKGEDDVVYLSDTRFYSTLLKWGSSIVEIISLLMVYGSKSHNQTVLFGVTLISAVVTPVLEFNQQLIQAYMDYVETAESLVQSTGLVDKYQKANKLVDQGKDAIDELPQVDVNTRALAAKYRNKKDPAAPAGTVSQAAPTATTGAVEHLGAASTIPPSATEPQVTSSPQPPSVPVLGAVQTSIAPQTPTVATAGQAMGISQLMNGITLHVGQGGNDSDHSDHMDHLNHFEHDKDDKDDDADDEGDGDDSDDDDDNESGEGGNDKTMAALVESTGLVKTNKDLIQLKAMPEVSYVVLTDALDAGEGEITISWQVNAKQRFHALDAIGMFPARAAGDLKLRTMDDCICYRLLKHQGVEPFGWSPKTETEDAEQDLIMLQARSLRDFSEREVTKMKKSVHDVKPEDSDDVVKARIERHTSMLELADSTVKDIMESPKLRPLKKKLPDILEEDIRQNKIHEKAPRTTRAFSLGAATREEAAKRVRKVVTGQVKFRPANNCVKEIDPKFETFVYGNDAGIYQSKYGLHGFEFYYLRCTEGEVKVVGISSGKEDLEGGPPGSKNQKVTPVGVPMPPSGGSSKNYELLDRFVSNQIQIGTFNIFMNLTCDRPLVGAKEKLNLSWIIYGVDYSILSHPQMRNCIGFYKVKGSEGSSCARIEIVPPSAYLESAHSEPCPGRMTVTTPNDPGVYEVRFLFNFFKKAQLHRQCQVFGVLEDEMQQLRIRSFYEKRAVTEELRKFSLREPTVWGIARMNTQAWLKAMLVSTLREPVDTSTIESTSAYSDFLFSRLKKKFQMGLESPSRMFQSRIARILSPLRLNSFLDVLMVALQSNSQLGDQLASVTFISPTEEDEKKRGFNKERDMLLLPSDKDLFLFGDVSFRLLAMNYLRQKSLCGYHDFIDDILLNHGQMMQTLDQIMNNLSSACVSLYESAITAAMQETMVVAKKMKRKKALRGLDIMLVDLCRNHIQSMIRAILETDCRTGRKWPGRMKGTFDKLMALRSGTGLVADADVSLEVLVDKTEDVYFGPAPYGGATPITREYIALRRWIKPKLERKIVSIMKQRHARMMDGNLPIVFQLVASCRRPGLSLAGNPFPKHRTMKTESPLYFLEESRDKAKQKESGEANDGAPIDDPKEPVVVDPYAADPESTRAEEDEARNNSQDDEDNVKSPDTDEKNDNNDDPNDSDGRDDADDRNDDDDASYDIVGDSS